VRYLNTPAPVSGPKDKTVIEALYQDDVVWLRHFWPLATTTVAYTDRIKFGVSGGLHGLYAGLGGSQPIAAPTNLVTWGQPAPTSPPGPYDITLDTAILLNEVHADATVSQPLALKALLFHFGPTSVPIDMRVWRGIPTGTYRVDLGADLDQDDHIDGSATSFTQVLSGRGDTISIPSLPAGQQMVLDLVLLSTSSSPPPTLDLGISPEDITSNGATVKVAVHNLATADFPAGTGAVVRLFDDVTNTTVALSPIPAVPAPVGLNPSVVPVILNYTAGAGQRLRARLVLPPAYTQVTQLNDRAVQQF
jgi:hypothetical protein